ncbi:uncharacterized protein [Leptinotarsa decemlineata]|uniref:uncharacterized protein n=1 Tax=Leptinotarsa decemlineata TaxID=7539 RepID=UPI003D30BC6B
MSRFLVVVWALVLALQIVHGNNAPKEQFELHEGNCSRALIGDMVFLDHVQLSRLPLVGRNTTTSWYGDQKIYCILALGGKQTSKDSTVLIKEGGINHTFVTLEFHSQKNHGLEYNVQVFGKLPKK